MPESKLDILSLDSLIKKNFENEAKNVQIYKDRLSELKKTAESKNIPLHLRNEVNRNILTLEEKIHKIVSRSEYNFYLMESIPYIRAYTELLNTPLKVSFMKKTKEASGRKNELITEYLKIAGQYHNFKPQIISGKKSKVACDNCENKNDFEIIDNAAIVCLQCGAQQELLLNLSSFKDVDRVNISTKYTYDRRVHFRDCINQYQGKQNSSIDEKIYRDLEEDLDRHHLLLGDRDTPKKIRYSKVKKHHVLMFLKERGYTKQYENLNLIYFNLTGKELDDISYLEDILMNDFDLLAEQYDKKFKNKIERSSFINTQHVLYQLLQRHKHPCKKEDFVLLKTVDRISFTDDICKSCFEDLGWNYIPLY